MACQLFSYLWHLFLEVTRGPFFYRNDYETHLIYKILHFFFSINHTSCAKEEWYVHLILIFPENCQDLTINFCRNWALKMKFCNNFDINTFLKNSLTEWAGDLRSLIKIKSKIKSPYSIVYYFWFVYLKYLFTSTISEEQMHFSCIHPVHAIVENNI